MSTRDNEETRDEAENTAPPADPGEVRELAEWLLRGLGLDVTIETRDAGATIAVDVSGPDSDYLLARKGEALDAAQYLLNRIVYRGRKGKKIHLDSGGFRKSREDEIVDIAVRSAQQVKAKGEEFVLSPLNPYERRLVHIALAEIQGVETRSIGDGFLKRVAILPSRKGGPDDTHGGA